MDLRPINILSLCTGGGGLDLGVELAMPDARPVCYVEREAFAAARLVEAMCKGLMAPAPLWSDVSTFRGRAWRGVVDWIIGGIPCQPHSHAGKRQGEDDERDLWSDTRRIVAAVRPRAVLIENVAGMLTAPEGQRPGAYRVRRDLQRMGYAVEGGLFRAADVGAPHERERVFILGVAHPGLNRWGADQGAQGRQSDTVRGNCDMGDAPGERRGQGRPEPVVRGGRGAASGDGGTMDDASGRRQQARSGSRPAGYRKGQLPTDDSGRDALVHARRAERRPLDAAPDLVEGDDGGRDKAAGRLGEPSAGLADTGCTGVQSRRGPEDLSEAAGYPEGEGDQRERDGRDTGDSEPSLAYPDESFLRGQSPTREQQILQPDDGVGLWPPAPSDTHAWANVMDRSPGRAPALSDAHIAAFAGLAEAHRLGAQGFTAEAESIVRRVADGLASRVDELRLLGNGVVPLEAADAVRTLLATHASRGCSYSARLVGGAVT